MTDKVYFTHKRNLTAGELSDTLSERVDFERFSNGCMEMLNMICQPQGPAYRRGGLEFLYDLTTLLGGTGVIGTIKPRAIPFIFSREQAYVLIFFFHAGTGNTRVAFATREGLVETSAGSGVPYIFEFAGVLDIAEFDYQQSNDVIKIAQPNRLPLDFKRLGHASWSATEISTTKIPPSGASGSDWSTGNYPRKVGFFEQRLVLASTVARPQTLWFSRGGDFQDFIIGVAAADDPMALTLNSGDQNTIEWMAVARVLLVGTLGDEWDISGKSGNPLSWESFSLARHTTEGSEQIKPIMIGPAVVFVERLGRTVRELSYNYATDSYDTVDLSVLAPHLTESNKLTSWTYQKTPNGVIWCVRDDGVGCGLTMKREHNIIGWHRHITDGLFIDFCAIPGDFETDVFAIVQRTIGGVDKWYIEVKAPEFVGSDARDCRFLDSFLYGEMSPAGSTVSGLEHLEGKTVGVFVNGRPHPSRVVVSGSITLDGDYDNVLVGLPYKSRIVSTTPVVSLDDGLSCGRITEIIEASVSVKNTAGMHVGIMDAKGNEELTYVPFVNPGDDDGSPASLETRYVNIDLPASSFDREANRAQHIVIEQNQPLPLTVLGIVEKVYISES